MKYGQVRRYWSDVAVSIGGGETRYLDVNQADALIVALQATVKDIRKYPSVGKSRCGTASFITKAHGE